MPASRPIPRQSLPEAIANDLRERILSGDLGEGETIRQEALAAEYDVSRMPVREALKRLDAEGLVQLTNNRGALVTKHSLAEIGEIFDLRQLIEVDLFRRAIPAMTSVDFVRCDKILAQMDASYDADDVAAWGALNHAFHTALYAAAGRGLTGELLSRVSLQADRYIRMHLSVMAQCTPAKADHHDLLELARDGAVDQACALLAEHIARPRSQLLDLIAARRAREAAQ